MRLRRLAPLRPVRHALRPRAAVIVPAGSWLEAQAIAIAAEAELSGVRSPLVPPDEPTDVVLYDPSLGAPPAGTPGQHVRSPSSPSSPRTRAPCSAAPKLPGDRELLASPTRCGKLGS